MYTASLDFGNKIALPNQWGHEDGLCKLINGLLRMDICQDSILGGGGGSVGTEPALLGSTG